MPFSGEKIVYKATCTSTNTIAMQLISTKNVPEGTIVITDNQSEGRGQRENSWISEPYKNLTFSLILYPNELTIKDNFSLNIITTLAIYEALRPYIPNDLFIKWPNDIYHQNNKIAGILIENVIKRNKITASVIGIGLNVNQTNFNLPNVSSLFLICGHEFNLSSLLLQLTNSIQDKYKQLSKQELGVCKTDYLDKLYWINQKRTFYAEGNYFEGIIQGVDEIGRLSVLKPNNELKYYNYKEIKFIN
jgi:BirA family biotin operon repressor/biotin-[acetyl-CoA-carboxylase] ligase